MAQGPSVPTAFTASAPTPPRPSPGVSPSMCLRVTRQGASAFNQPLSLDTSSVTDTAWMFVVHPRAHAVPSVLSRALRARCVLRHRPTRPRASHPCVALHVPRCESAGCVCVQPAAEPRHVQRHDHVRHVLRAHPPHACRAPSRVSSRFLRARCVHRHTAPTRPRAS